MKLRCMLGARGICLGLTGYPCQSVTPCGKITGKEVSSQVGTTQELTVELSVTATCSTGHSMLMFNTVSVVDAPDVAVDISTSNTVGLDGAGTGTLMVKQGETALGSTAFGHVMLGSMRSLPIMRR